MLTFLKISSLAILLAFATSSASLAEDLGPPVGIKAPGIGAPLDQTGTARTLNDLMGKKGLVLMFFRSADWCPFCQAQLIEMNGGLGDIEKHGYKVAGISYDTPETQLKFVEKRQIGFPLLSDPKSEIIDRYGLRDPQYAPGSKAYGVPRPIIFVLNPAGTITAKLYEETFRTRPPVSAVVAQLDALNAPH